MLEFYLHGLPEIFGKEKEKSREKENNCNNKEKECKAKPVNEKPA